MEHVERDDREWITMDVPPDIAQLLNESTHVTAFGIKDKSLAMAGHDVKVSNTPAFAHVMFHFLESQYHNMIAYAEQREKMLDCLRTRSKELADEIEAKVSELGDMLDDYDLAEVDLAPIVRDLVGLLGQSVGQFRALEGLQGDPDDILGGYTLGGVFDDEELRGSVSDADPDPADDGADVDGSGQDGTTSGS